MRLRNCRTCADAPRTTAPARIGAMLTVTVSLLAMGLQATAQPAPELSEQIHVTGQRIYPVVDTVAPSTEDAVDTAELLKQLPGANVNANGMLTGIAQYRGLYGDRVAVSIDGLRIVTGGPNAMDAPLSYASPLLLERMSVTRGITSVSSATESIGGHFHASYDRGKHGDTAAIGTAGSAQLRYGSNGALSGAAARLVLANDTHRFALLGQRDRADDFEFDGGRLTPTRLGRQRVDVSYAVRGDRVEALIHAGRLDTRDTGTPSLPMDIRYIDTDLYGARIRADIAAATSMEIAIGYSDVGHVMDNHRLRTAPASPAGYRETLATGNGYSFRVGTLTRVADREWRVGVDGQTASYAALITNPNVPAFGIDNFAGVSRDIVGLYGQWNGSSGRFDFEAGARINRINADSGDAAASIPAMNPMMEMMAANAATLAEAFNGSDRRRSYRNVDAVVKVGRVLGDMRSVYVELARKTRAPSYQELYLWLPLESTGGLADGRSYIGDLSLRSEVSREINAGANWNWNRAWLAPQTYVKDIAGYIQGIPSSNMTANMVATMMSGAPALQFANTDAGIRGLDVAWGVYIAQHMVLEGVASHVRGRRTDEDDDLYRIMPTNAQMGLRYESGHWSAGTEVIAYARQRRVATFNGERPTRGYSIVNLNAHWQLQSGLRLSATVANVFDRRYRDHLSGINRVLMADVPVGERLYGRGRSLNMSASFTW